MKVLERRGGFVLRLAHAFGPVSAALLLALGIAASAPAAAQTSPPDTTAAPGVDLVPTPMEPTVVPTPEAGPDSTAARGVDGTLPPPTTARRAYLIELGRDRDRFEWGAAVVDGPFDVLGTFGYHRFLRRGGPFEHWLHVELAFGVADYLTEGALSGGYLFRPLRTIRRDWKIRPILEGGPTGHAVVQVADVRGFEDTAFHLHAYLKTHAYAGFEALFGRKWGLVVRGRLTVPAHRPLDYAQIALFLR